MGRKITISFECDELDARSLISIFSFMSEPYSDIQVFHESSEEWLGNVAFLVDRLIDLDLDTRGWSEYSKRALSHLCGLRDFLREKGGNLE